MGQGTIARDPETLGVFDWNTASLRVDGDGGSWLRGLGATAGLGVEHIGEGADHLLFLLLLLIPAPLVARRGRWRRRDDAGRSVLRVVHVVTAFAIGHSITLSLASFGLVQLPARLVESLIALSILVSAVHVLRPLVPGGEALLAAGFGLVHGLAFATLLGDLGLTGSSLASSLLGFNLGIEITQLLVVALLMPSLYVLSRTAAYGAVRVSVALLGIVVVRRLAARADRADTRRPVRFAVDRAGGAPVHRGRGVRAAGRGGALPADAARRPLVAGRARTTPLTRPGGHPGSRER